MKNSHRTQKIAFFFLLVATLLIVVPVVMIVVIIIQKGLPAVSWQFLSDIPRQGMRAGGIFPAIIGTMYLVAGAIIFALPIGLLAAIYLSEYSKDNLLNRVIKLAIVNLAGENIAEGRCPWARWRACRKRQTVVFMDTFKR